MKADRIESAFAKDVDSHINDCFRSYPGFGDWPEDAQVGTLINHWDLISKSLKTKGVNAKMYYEDQLLDAFYGK